jgi:type VI secretion system secreted protein Hcp
MALNAYLKLKGQKQGNIKGGVIAKGHSGEIAVIAMSHGIVSPRDPQSGLPTGKRMHKPLVITKELDQSTPLLMYALVNNENITSFTLNFYEPNVQGMTTNYYRIELVNANIASIETRMDNIAIHPDLEKYEPFEEVAFTYQKITVTYVVGGITASDDWETPVA